MPERDKLSTTKHWCEAKLAMAFGGRVAEQLIYGEDHLDSGASSDIQNATAIARAMVMEWGMSPKLGPLRYAENQQEVFLGHSISQRQNMSEETARLIDDEVRRIVGEGYTKAREIVYANKDRLERITRALIEYETISGEECQNRHGRWSDLAQSRRRRRAPCRPGGAGRRPGAPAARRAGRRGAAAGMSGSQIGRISELRAAQSGHGMIRSAGRAARVSASVAPGGERGPQPCLRRSPAIRPRPSIDPFLGRGLTHWRRTR